VAWTSAIGFNLDLRPYTEKGVTFNATVEQRYGFTISRLDADFLLCIINSCRIGKAFGTI
jgi:hypothetical protein